MSKSSSSKPDDRRDVLSLIGRIANFYRFFNQQNWDRCYEYIDPKLRGDRKSDLKDYAQGMAGFFSMYGPLHDVNVVKRTLYPGKLAKTDQRDFAYAVISWKDRNGVNHTFNERWIKDRDKWYTRVVGLVSVPASPQVAGERAALKVSRAVES